MDNLILLLVLLFLSAFFSGSETALTSISKVRVATLYKQGVYGSKALFQLKENTDRALIAILIGNNLVNIGASAIATVLATEHFGHNGLGLAVGMLTLFILIFGEISPKTFAIHYAVCVSLFVAPFLNMFAFLVTPLVWVLEKLTTAIQRFSQAKAEPTITETELIFLACQGANEGSIERDEQEMIKRIFSFDSLCAEDVMVPRNNIFALDGNKSIRETLPEILAQPHSRIPLHNDNLEEISHVVNIREILDEVAKGNLDRSLFEIGHEPLFVPASQPIDTLLEKLRVQKTRLVMVVDDRGILQGLLTLEDLLEELVGEITSEMDRQLEPKTEVLEGELRVDAGVELRVVEEFFGTELGKKPTNSISSWILAETGYIPVRHDDRFVIDGLVVTVEQASHRAIRKVRISRPATVLENTS